MKTCVSGLMDRDFIIATNFRLSIRAHVSKILVNLMFTFVEKSVKKHGYTVGNGVGIKKLNLEQTPPQFGHARQILLLVVETQFQVKICNGN